MDETLRTALMAARALDRLGVPWFIGGSLASSIHGVARATLDADLVADLQPAHVAPLCAELGTEWYADEGAMRDALARRSCFNLIHFGSSIKVDVFVPKRRRFESGQFARARPTPIFGDAMFHRECAPRRTSWRRSWNGTASSGETSERQWSDIVGVLRVNAGRLDLELLHASAQELEVTRLNATRARRSRERHLIRTCA